MRKPHANATFVRVVTDSGASLMATRGHYLLSLPASYGGLSSGSPPPSPLGLSAWRYVLPAQVAPGDWVPVHVAAAPGADGSPSPSSSHGGVVRPERVARLELVDDVGVYMPHTVHGGLVVDGLLATEMSDVVPRWAAGPRVHAAGVALMRLLARALPDALNNQLPTLVARLGHGHTPGVPSVFYSRADLMTALREEEEEKTVQQRRHHCAGTASPGVNRAACAATTLPTSTI